MQTGVLMLGYAVEAHLKHVLAYDPEVGKKYRYGHDFMGLFQALRDGGYMHDVEVSEDLLHFVEDNFDRRYPSQTNRTLKRAEDRGHAISMSPSVITAYDELIMQLDMSILRLFDSPGSSIMFKAAQGIDTAGVDLFFHSNYSAVARIETAVSLCDRWLEELKRENPNIYEVNLRSHRERLPLLDDQARLLRSERASIGITPRGGFEGALKASKEFVYPGRYRELPDGTRVFESSF
ncbi:hypothetical protein C41B8_16944 [Salinisphaera hydrothermalis C41B8]|uniref:Uncharacterized protein n=2 Tax=Salinisphaera TaxID=180541 RepID=A0A084IH81_SALHC|nr:hypothetical protein C41B8_16944 [Salinisphaera hydrothermalis C41B8]